MSCNALALFVAILASWNTDTKSRMHTARSAIVCYTDRHRLWQINASGQKKDDTETKDGESYTCIVVQRRNVAS